MRELPDGKLALEDCTTRRQSVYEKGDLLNQIWSGRITVLNEAVRRDAMAAAGAPPIQALADLKASVRRELERCVAYLDGMRKAHVTKGMRSKIAQVIDTVAARLGDKKKPSTSAVMDWARQVEAAGGHVGAVVDKRAFRKSGPRIPAVMEEIVTKALRCVYLTRDRHSLVHTQAVIHAEAARKVRTGELQQDDARVSLATLSRRVAAICNRLPM